jgi:hypothetical protein
MVLGPVVGGGSDALSMAQQFLLVVIEDQDTNGAGAGIWTAAAISEDLDVWEGLVSLWRWHGRENTAGSVSPLGRARGRSSATSVGVFLGQLLPVPGIS